MDPDKSITTEDRVPSVPPSDNGEDFVASWISEQRRLGCSWAFEERDQRNLRISFLRDRVFFDLKLGATNRVEELNITYGSFSLPFQHLELQIMDKRLDRMEVMISKILTTRDDIPYFINYCVEEFKFVEAFVHACRKLRSMFTVVVQSKTCLVILVNESKNFLISIDLSSWYGGYLFPNWIKLNTEYWNDPRSVSADAIRNLTGRECNGPYAVLNFMIRVKIYLKNLLRTGAHQST